jgi:predicted nuclease of predicted toxin-antitoxin system
VKFLIDECLTTRLVRVANEHGHESHHVAHLNLAGLGDWHVTDYAIAHDCALVTNNAADFRRIYAERELHPGLVILIPNVPLELQQRLFAAALAQIAEYGEPINQVLEVDLQGEEVVMSIYDLPVPPPLPEDTA